MRKTTDYLIQPKSTGNIDHSGRNCNAVFAEAGSATQPMTQGPIIYWFQNLLRVQELPESVVLAVGDWEIPIDVMKRVDDCVQRKGEQQHHHDLEQPP